MDTSVTKVEEGRSHIEMLVQLRQGEGEKDKGKERKRRRKDLKKKKITMPKPFLEKEEREKK